MKNREIKIASKNGIESMVYRGIKFSSLSKRLKSMGYNLTNKKVIEAESRCFLKHNSTILPKKSFTIFIY